MFAPISGMNPRGSAFCSKRPAPQGSVMPSEIWRPVRGYNGAYLVSDQGRVRSVDRVTSNGHRLQGRLIKLQRTTDGGYPVLGLSRAGIVKTRCVHSLVLEAWFGPRPRGKECCHLDGRPDNNSISNLRWASKRMNANDTIRMNRHCSGQDHPHTKLKDRDVRLLRDLRHRKGLTYKQLAERFGISRGGVGLIVRRVNWSRV